MGKCGVELSVEADVIDDEFKKKVAEQTEVATYMMIYAFDKYRWQMHHDRGRGHITEKDWPSVEKDIQKVKDRQWYVLSQVTRFGVETPISAEGKPTLEARKWNQWWNDYIQKVLTEGEWRDLELKVRDNEDVSEFRPEGDWRDIEGT